jgi:hypothetical protein
MVKLSDLATLDAEREKAELDGDWSGLIEAVLTGDKRLLNDTRTRKLIAEQLKKSLPDKVSRSKLQVPRNLQILINVGELIALGYASYQNSGDAETACSIVAENVNLSQERVRDIWKDRESVFRHKSLLKHIVRDRIMYYAAIYFYNDEQKPLKDEIKKLKTKFESNYDFFTDEIFKKARIRSNDIVSLP